MDRKRPLLEITALAESYGGKAALAGTDLAVGPREFVVLLGPKGAGKTALLNTLCRLLPPAAGEVRIAGYRLRSPPAAPRHPQSTRPGKGGP